MERIAENRSFGGWHRRYKHRSDVLDCDMTFSVYLPPEAESGRVPVLYWLSGLTCTDENFMQKAGAHRLASELGMAILCPDTSPRDVPIPEQDDSYDLGSGAGFYVNALREPWSRHYRMYDYVIDELPRLAQRELPITDARAISGHSMGGHGALVCALRNPGRFVSVSALAPICNPMACPWGKKAFSAYLGEDRSQWAQYDATLLIADATERLELLIDQGTGDEFLKEQLLPQNLEQACKEAGHPLTLNRREGYDHSYYFVATFIADHLRHHARKLGL